MKSRKAALSGVGSIVVKLGSQLLSGAEGRLDAGFIASMATQVAALRERQIAVTIVSSGAIAAGLGELKLPKRPKDLANLQAVAAVGQRRLMDTWADAFEPFGMPVAQLLLTREDVDNRKRFLNVRNTIHAAHSLGAVPIINENDTISTDEIVRISFGDNDILASHVASALNANLLVLLSVVDGLLDERGAPVRWVQSVSEAQQLVRTEKSSLGKGGMSSKLQAARAMTDAGEAMIVADGRMSNVLLRLIDGEELGTLFAPATRKLSGRSRWIGSARPAGTIVIDQGATQALVEKNRSLLPAGITRTEGDFERGDIVAIVDAAGKLVGRGLTNYSAEDITRIAGKKTAEVRSLLEEAAYDEVVHRDNLVVGGA
jgi:glutamate 5-kinase